MALYTILFGLSIFLIALVSAIIKKMFFHWKQEHKIERMMVPAYVEHPTISIIIICEKCVIRRRTFADKLAVCDIISKSDMSLAQETPEAQQSILDPHPSDPVPETHPSQIIPPAEKP